MLLININTIISCFRAKPESDFCSEHTSFLIRKTRLYSSFRKMNIGNICSSIPDVSFLMQNASITPERMKQEEPAASIILLLPRRNATR